MRCCAAARRRDDIHIVRVPGAWEIPAAARTLANLGNVSPASLDAIITLGCLLRGETAHYEAIYNEVSRGIGQSQQETGIPHSFGVLTCETLEQALNRAGIKAGNKGFEAAFAAIEMVSLRRKLLEKRQLRDRRERGASRANWPCRCSSRPTSASRLRIRCAPPSGRPATRSSRRSAALPKTCSAWPSPTRSASTSSSWPTPNTGGWSACPPSIATCCAWPSGEMIGFKSTPFPIVINEALEIGRRYSAPESINFLNGMLDAVARSLVAD